MQNQETPKTLTATERLQNLEMMVLSHEQILNNVASQSALLYETVKAMVENNGAVERVLQKANIMTQEAKDKELEEIRLKLLKDKLTVLVDNGTLVPATVVTEKSFFVGREVSKETLAVVTPRLQFLVTSLDPEGQQVIIGKSVGDQIQFPVNDKILFEIEEVYDVYDAPAPQEIAPEALPQ